MTLELINTAGLIVVGMLGYLNARAIKEVHVLINSRMTELLSVTKTSSHAEGVKEQKDKEAG